MKQKIPSSVRTGFVWAHHCARGAWQSERFIVKHDYPMQQNARSEPH
ncbi:protein of unknown function [Streptomyces murinus]